MKKEDITVVAQLLTAIKEATEKLEKAVKKGNAEEARLAKNEILNMQKEIDKIL